MDPRPARFASDEFEDLLWRADARESAVARPHARDFLVLAPTLAAAQALRDRLERGGLAVAIADYAGDAAFPWQLTVTASLRDWAVEKFVARLASIAALAGGRLPYGDKPLAPGGTLV
jgi:hypothetical protein